MGGWDSAVEVSLFGALKSGGAMIVRSLSSSSWEDSAVMIRIRDARDGRRADGNATPSGFAGGASVALASLSEKSSDGSGRARILPRSRCRRDPGVLVDGSWVLGGGDGVPGLNSFFNAANMSLATSAASPLPAPVNWGVSLGAAARLRWAARPVFRPPTLSPFRSLSRIDSRTSVSP